MNALRFSVLVLAAAVVASALGVIYARHENRRYFIELQQARKARDALNVEWGRLQLEQSTWATQARIEQVARKQLHMIMPSRHEVVIVRP
ncbi:MAG: cell division protein FtsL [Gammaproteobacteria bacterium]|jgi:cell division protein FtsL